MFSSPSSIFHWERRATKVDFFSQQAFLFGRWLMIGEEGEALSFPAPKKVRRRKKIQNPVELANRIRALPDTNFPIKKIYFFANSKRVKCQQRFCTQFCLFLFPCWSDQVKLQIFPEKRRCKGIRCVERRKQPPDPDFRTFGWQKMQLFIGYVDLSIYLFEIFD